jgi:hypothetical protein
VNLSDLAAASAGGSQKLGLSFDTSSLALLGDVLSAAAHGGNISNVSLAFRGPGHGGRPDTERVDTFATAEVASMTEQVTGQPKGSVALLLSAAGDLTSTHGTQEQAGRFAPLSIETTARANVTLGDGTPAYEVSAVSLIQLASGAPFTLGFTTSALPLLDRVFKAEGTAATLRGLTLTVHDGAGDGQWSHTFSKLSVSAFAENVSGQLAGTATLTGRPR